MRVRLRAAGALLLSITTALSSVEPAFAEWLAGTPLPVSYVQTRTVAGGGRLYRVGGLGEKGICGSSDVHYAPIGADGAAGQWIQTTSLPGAGSGTITVTCAGAQYELSDVVHGWGFELLYHAGRVYVLGGNLWAFNMFPDGQRIHFTNQVLSAPVQADGSLGAWRDEAPLPAPAFYAAGAVANGTLYLSGGREAADTSVVSRRVLRAAPGADGAIASWTADDSLMPGALWLHGAAIAGGRLYLSGGVTWDPYPADQITNGVLSAPINADSSLGAWREENALTLGIAGHGFHPRGGALYTVGGREPDVPTSAVHSSPLGEGGALGAWTDADALPVGLFNHGTAAGNGSLFAIGGSDGSSMQRAAYSLPDRIAPAAVADLSASAADQNALTVEWTAPGDDGATGAVSNGRWELRVSPDPAAVATAVPDVWTASWAPGEEQSRTIGGLEAGTVYYVSLRAADAAGNLSAASNLASAETLAPASPNPVPVASSLSPASALAGSGPAVVTVAGSGFVDGSVVRWNGADRPTTFGSSESLSAEISAADLSDAGASAVSVFSPAPGGGLSGALTFAVNNPAPALASLSPASAAAGSGAFALTLDGAGFTPASTARWNGGDRPTTFVSSTRLTAAISAADVSAAGAASVTVRTPAPGGGTTSALTFSVENVVPAIAAISPSEARAGDPGFALTVDGSGFLAGSVVRWNGASRTTTFVSASRLTAAISASDLGSAGARAVTVFNPAPGGGASEPATFTVHPPLPPPNPVPSVTSLSPASAVAGSAGFNLTVNGAGFAQVSVARWNGEDRPTTFVNATRLTVAVSAADVAAAGAASVTVFSPAPGGGASSPASFTINNPAPAIASLSPASALAGGAAFTLTVDGSGFVAGSSVRWNGAARPTTFVSASRLTAAVSAADVAAAGTRAVTVFTAAPGGGTSASASFSVNNPAPSLAAISPDEAVEGSGAFTLTLEGSGFTPASVARWNGSDRPTTFVSATRLTAAIAASDVASAGERGVTVFTAAPGGGTSAARAFDVQEDDADAEALSMHFVPDNISLRGRGGWHVAVIKGTSEAPAWAIDAKSVRVTAVDGRAAGPLKPVKTLLIGGRFNGKSHDDDRDRDWKDDKKNGKGKDKDDRHDRRKKRSGSRHPGYLALVFEKPALAALLATPGTRSVTATGSLKDRRTFAATGSLRAVGAPAKPSALLAESAKLVRRFWPAPAPLLVLKTESCVTGAANGPKPAGRKGRHVAKDKVAVRLPDDAAEASLPITIDVKAPEAAPDREERRITTGRKGLAEAGDAVEFGPHGTRFSVPVTIELPFDPDRLPANADFTRLAVHYWNAQARDWEKLPSVVDRAARVVRAQTSHFSTYQVLFGAQAAGDLQFVDAYAFPNPSRGGAPVTLRIQPGPATTVEFALYDAAGRKVYGSNDFSYRPAFDDGNGKGAHDTYDHVVGVGGLASGVYTWVITARKEGKPDVRKSGKAGIVK